MAERKLLCGGGGGGVTRKPIFPTPPSLLGRRDARGGVQGGGARPAVPGGGGVNPTSMAQNDTHVALIILTTQMWGGGGGDYWWKKLFRAKFCVPVPLVPTSVLTQNKGPDTEPHFSNPPPPSFGGRPCHPPPPAEQFSGRPFVGPGVQGGGGSLRRMCQSPLHAFAVAPVKGVPDGPHRGRGRGGGRVRGTPASLPQNDRHGVAVIWRGRIVGDPQGQPWWWWGGVVRAPLPPGRRVGGFRGRALIKWWSEDRCWLRNQAAQRPTQTKKNLKKIANRNDVLRDALGFAVKTWARHKSTETSIEQWLAVGGGWRLAVGGPSGLSLTKKRGFQGQPWDGGSGFQKCVYQKWPESVFLFVNFTFCRHEIWVQAEKGVQRGVPPLPLTVASPIPLVAILSFAWPRGGTWSWCSKACPTCSNAR